MSTTQPCIEYESTFEDIVAFNKYHFARFADQNYAALKILEIPLTLLLAATAGFYVWRSWAFTALAVVIAFFVRRFAEPYLPYVRSRTARWVQNRSDKVREKLLRRMLAEAPNDAVLGQQRLSLTAEGLPARP